MQQQLSSAGAKVTLERQSTAALQGKIFGSGDWDVLIIGIGVANPAQISAFLSGPTPPNGINFAGITNAGYKLAVARAIKTGRCRRAASTGSTASGRSSRRPTSRRWPSRPRPPTARA